MRKNRVYIVIFVLFATSCSITQEYHFNNNYSGDAKTSIDLSMLKGFMSGLDSTGNDNSLDTMDRSLAEIADALKLTGVENVQYGWNNDKTVLFISYNFKDIETFNKAAGAEQQGSTLLSMDRSSNDKIRITAKGKNFFYDSPEITKEDTIFNSESMASMKDYYKYKLILNFDRKIKRLDNKKAVLSEDKKSIEYSGNIADMFAKGSSFDVHLKFATK